MFSVVEFSDDESVAIVRSCWITPNKKQSAWPPFKNPEKIKKCLTGSVPNDESWNVFTIRRIFYVTDDLLSARKKCKEAELNSEVELDIELKRKHKKPPRYMSLSSEEDEDDGHGIKFPKPPKEPGRKIIAEETVAEIDNTEPGRKQIIAEETVAEMDNTGVLVRQTSDASTISTSSVAASNAVIARHLAKLEEGIKELQLNQKEILERLRSGATATAVGHQALSLPEGVNFPCTQIEEIEKVDVWLREGENYMLLVNHLSYVGGNKTSAIIRRILEKLFSNKLAETCNWTGKNGKYKLQDHLLIKVVTEAIRRHKVAETATENEVKTVISNWFRFAKDRDGGRESRRRTIEPTSIQQ